MTKRYYDLIETPYTGKTFTKDGANRLAETDLRVSIYFQSIDKVKYDRGFNAEGYPVLKEYALKDDGTRYSHYLPDMVNNIFVPDAAKLEELYTRQTIALYKTYYMDIIAAKLKELDYDSLSNVVLWAADPTFGVEATKILTWYKAIIAFNYQLINDVKSGIKAMPAKEEYLAQLPQYEG